MSRRSSKSKIEIIAVHKSLDHLRRDYREREIAFANSYSFYTDIFLRRIIASAQTTILKFPFSHMITSLTKKFCFN